MARPYRATAPKRIPLAAIIARAKTLSSLSPDTEEALRWLENETEVTGMFYPQALALLLLRLEEELPPLKKEDSP